MGALRHVPRTVATLAVGFVATILASLAVMVLARKSPSHPGIERVARTWSRVWLAVAGVELVVRGDEGVDRSRSYVVVANHASILDIMACFLAVPVPIRFLAKKELFRIPLLAPAMRAIGIVPVDRQARGAVHDQINVQARRLVEMGRSLIVYPEGTRPRSDELAGFKKGAFTIAVGTRLPVLPVAIHGSRRAWPPSTPWVHGGRIEVIVGEPIETGHLTHADVGTLRDETREVIARNLQEMATGTPQS